jgi:hypothetical protein
MSVKINVDYRKVCLVHGKRFEVEFIAYDDWLNRAYEWEVYSFSAKPTSRQFRDIKKRFYSRIMG